MEIHYLDIIGWFVMILFIMICLPEDCREELGFAVVGLPILFTFTIIYIIIFGFIDYNIIDIWNSIELHISINK